MIGREVRNDQQRAPADDVVAIERELVDLLVLLAVGEGEVQVRAIRGECEAEQSLFAAGRHLRGQIDERLCVEVVTDAVATQPSDSAGLFGHVEARVVLADRHRGGRGHRRETSERERNVAGGQRRRRKGVLADAPHDDRRDHDHHAGKDECEQLGARCHDVIRMSPSCVTEATRLPASV